MVIDHVWGVSRRFFEDQIPGELIYRVPRSFRNYAAKLLGGSDIIPLSKQQCRSLSCPSDVDRILGELMANRKQQLDLMLEAGHSKHEPIVVDLRTEVEELERWRGRLHPFLAKAVALDESASGPFLGFSGHLTGDTLLIRHVSEGNHPLPMENLPVVVFLERQPANIYREASMSRADRLPLVRPDDSIDITIEP
jgi:hypothetical protein